MLPMPSTACGKMILCQQYKMMMSWLVNRCKVCLLIVYLCCLLSGHSISYTCSLMQIACFCHQQDTWLELCI
uniref:Uncharacterized protein n=2 Tax=Anguilla anguilla TaxID=7936 RepID=A0A0E9UG49_ANGAN